MPVVSIDAMNQHLAEISKCVSVSAIALLILDGAGWHSSPQLILPKNIVLMPLPSYAPELNSVENIWDYLRSNFLSHCVWDTYEAILDACCDAWNALMAKSEVIVSIGTREWAQVKIEDIRPAWARGVLSVSSAILAIPGKARFQLPHLTAHDLEVLVRSSATRAASAAQSGPIERN